MFIEPQTIPPLSIPTSTKGYGLPGCPSSESLSFVFPRSGEMALIPVVEPAQFDVNNVEIRFDVSVYALEIWILPPPDLTRDEIRLATTDSLDDPEHIIAVVPKRLMKTFSHSTDDESASGDSEKESSTPSRFGRGDKPTDNVVHSRELQFCRPQIQDTARLVRYRIWCIERCCCLYLSLCLSIRTDTFVASVRVNSRPDCVQAGNLGDIRPLTPGHQTGIQPVTGMIVSIVCPLRKNANGVHADAHIVELNIMLGRPVGPSSAPKHSHGVAFADIPGTKGEFTAKGKHL